MVSEIKTRHIKSKNTLLDSIKKISSRVLALVKDKKLVQVNSKRFLSLGSQDILRIISNIETKDPVDRLARAVLLKTAYQLEQKSAGSSFLLIYLLSGMDFEIETQKKLSKNDIKDFGDALIGEDATEVFSRAIEIAGPLASFVLEKSERETFFRVSESLEIPISRITEFGNNLDLRSYRLLSFDGVIEKVSEINKILESCVDLDSGLVIYCRGFGIEVVSTLLHNWRLKKLKVIPVTARVEDISNFYFVDLPTVVNEIEPGLHALNLSMVNLSDLPLIEKMVISENALSITDKRVSKNCSRSIEKIQKEGYKESMNWVNERARRLSARRIELFLGTDMGDMDGLFNDRINTLIRFLMDSRKSGISKIKLQDGKSLQVPSSSIKICREALGSLELETKVSSMVVFDNG